MKRSLSYDLLICLILAIVAFIKINLCASILFFILLALQTLSYMDDKRGYLDMYIKGFGEGILLITVIELLK